MLFKWKQDFQGPSVCGGGIQKPHKEPAMQLYENWADIQLPPTAGFKLTQIGQGL